MPASRTPQRRATRPRTPPKVEPGTMTYLGESYRLDESQGIWPILQFARAAEAGLNMTDPRGLAAIHAFLQDCLHPDDWGRFQEDMVKKKFVDLDGLMTAAREAVEAQMAKLEEAQKSKAVKGKVISDASEDEQ
jgi:hypothetical protein